MTLYSFKCSAANHEIEEFFPLGEAPQTITCPDDDAPARRLLARGNFATFPGSYKATTR